MTRQGWLSDYKPSGAGFDEAMDANGQLRDVWQDFARRMAHLGEEGRHEVVRAASQTLIETGIAFDIYADPEDRSAAWKQDYAPLLLSSKDWATLSSGLVQRARAIEALLQDIYGEQSFVERGYLPAGSVFGNPSYLHEVQGWAKKPEHRLGFYACDLTRRADGHWQVLSDNTGIPNGLGWILASRIALAGAYGDVFTGCGVERLAGFFDEMSQFLTPEQAGKAVILAPGPQDKNYFSHAYLARYLGLQLVETGDLTLRGGTLQLKTLAGLEPVATLFRKIRADQLDCLGFAGSSYLGSPGLLRAVREGNLRCINAPGSGVADNRLLAFLNPEFWEVSTGCQPMFYEAPALWLGDDSGIERFLGEPGWHVGPICGVRQIADQRTLDPVAALATTDQKRTFLLREGHRLVAERETELPTSPAWSGDAITSRHWALRCFVGRDGSGRFQVLPGGIVHQTAEARSVGMPVPEAIKDMWVLLPPGERTEPSTLPAKLAGVHLRRTGRRLLSRTAESLFWLGRYAERAEMGMRTVRAALHRLNEDEGTGGPPEALADIVRVLADHCEIKVQGNHEGISEALLKILFVKPLDYGLQQSLEGIQHNAALARGELSQDGARVLRWQANDTRWRPHASRHTLNQAPAMLSAGIQRLMAFTGTQNDNMTRDFAYLFLSMGRHCERSLRIINLAQWLIVSDQTADAAFRQAAMLEIADSSMTYRSRYGAGPMAAPVIDLLVLDETNPRSLAFQVERFEQALGLLSASDHYRSDEHRLVLWALTRLRMLDADALAKADEAGELPLQEVLRDIGQHLMDAADRLSIRHFAKTEVPQISFAMRRGLT